MQPAAPLDLTPFRAIPLTPGEIGSAFRYFDRLRFDHNGAAGAAAVILEAARLDLAGYHTTNLSAQGNADRVRLAKRLRGFGLMLFLLETGGKVAPESDLFPEVSKT